MKGFLLFMKFSNGISFAQVFDLKTHIGRNSNIEIMDDYNSPFNYNWTAPILKNVVHSLNNSLYGIQTTKNNECWNEISLLQLIPQAAQYGTITALIVIILTENFLLKKEFSPDKNKLTLQYLLPEYVSKFSTIASLCIFLLFLPILLMILTLFYVYKRIVSLILTIKLNNNFINMMNGIDAVWAVEEDNALSVINVVATVDMNLEKSGRCLLNTLRSVVKSKLFQDPSICPKMLYKKSFYMGYNYWMTNNNININDYVRTVNFNINSKNKLTQNDLEEFVSDISNSKLPYDNNATWEILISDKPIENTTMFPIVFRIHHCLGDGVALLKLLLNTIGCNKNDKHKTNINTCNDFEKALIYFIESMNVKNIIFKLKEMVSYIRKIILIFVKIPQTLINQMLRPADDNILHGPSLNGNKIVTWISEESDHTQMLTTIKQLKKRLPGVTFSELILAALSESLHIYFRKKHQTIPDLVTAVVPVRMDSSSLYTIEYKKDKVLLENKFSVAMLTVPIKCNESNIINPFKRLIEVRNETDALRNSADFYVNYGLMKISGFFFPDSILRPLVDSVQATLVISNLPGPSDVYICGKYKLDKMAFFVPHRGITGIGLTILSCNEKLNFGIMVDKALIENKDEAKDILKEIIISLDYLNKMTSKDDVSRKTTWY